MEDPEMETMVIQIVEEATMDTAKILKEPMEIMGEMSKFPDQDKAADNHQSAARFQLITTPHRFHAFLSMWENEEGSMCWI